MTENETTTTTTKVGEEKASQNIDNSSTSNNSNQTNAEKVEVIKEGEEIKKEEPKLDPKIENEKVISALAYLIFFIPLLAIPASKFGKFHANQSLNLTILSFSMFIITLVIGWIPIIGWLISLAIFFAYIAIIIFGLIAFIGALQGKADRLPLIGKYELIK